MSRPFKSDLKRVSQSVTFDPRLLAILQRDAKALGMSLGEAIEVGILKLYNCDSCAHLHEILGDD